MLKPRCNYVGAFREYVVIFREHVVPPTEPRAQTTFAPKLAKFLGHLGRVNTVLKILTLPY
mgnify:CR=1 FL=1